MMLAQDKLDVVFKKQTNPFSWKGQFTPDFVEYILDIYAKPGMLILDTFSGSGTVIYESIKKKCNCVGYEINPSAFYMSKFYEYAGMHAEERWSFCCALKELLAPAIKFIPRDMHVCSEGKDYREVYRNLLRFSSWVSKHVAETYWPFIINTLFLCEKDKRLLLSTSILNNFRKMENFLYSLPFCEELNIVVKNEDARSISHKLRNKVDLIFTSPPYINVFNYHQNYRGIIECFNYDVMEVARREIGANRKNRSNRYRTVVQYAIEMGEVLVESANTLKVGGKMVYIVGKVSCVRRTPFYNSEIIKDIVANIYSLRLVEENYRCFKNRYGETIKEDILTIEKISNQESMHANTFKDIGMKHLNKALGYAPIENRADIYSVIDEIRNKNITKFNTL